LTYISEFGIGLPVQFGKKGGGGDGDSIVAVAGRGLSPKTLNSKGSQPVQVEEIPQRILVDALKG
jgi:hypothetical protein